MRSIEKFFEEEGITGADQQYMEKGMADKVDSAKRWIQANLTEINSTLYPQKDCYHCKYFEDWVVVYEELRPGTARAFMFAWYDIFGGV